jgi:monoterpene epsilon-lactone hydrolase
MASKESADLLNLYQGITRHLAEHPDASLEDFRRLLEHVGDVGAEPGATDYLEVDAGGVACLWAIPRGAREDTVLIGVHGGGYATGSRYSHRKLYAHLAKAMGCRALIVDYRRAPENPHPGPLDDVVSAYRWLLRQGIGADRIVIAGDSAGGALTIAAPLRGAEQGLPAPRALIAMSPWVDMEAKGATIESNAAKDALVSRGLLDGVIAGFLGPDGDPRDPLANVLYADLSALPPLYVQASADEALLADSERVVDRARAAGVDVTFETVPQMQHVFQFMAGNAPEADAAIRNLADWAVQKLGDEAVEASK